MRTIQKYLVEARSVKDDEQYVETILDVPSGLCNILCIQMEYNYPFIFIEVNKNASVQDEIRVGCVESGCAIPINGRYFGTVIKYVGSVIQPQSKAYHFYVLPN